MKSNQTIKKLNFFNRYYVELERPSERLIEKRKNRAQKWFSKKEIDKNSNNPFVMEEDGLIIFI